VRAVPQEIVLIKPGEIGCDSLSVGSISNVEETLNGKQNELLRSSATQSDVSGQISCDTFLVGGVDINTVIGTDIISFRATRTVATTVQTLEVLPFNTITYNLGDGYDDSIYTFTAPKSGIYFFYAVITSNIYWLYLEFRKSLLFIPRFSSGRFIILYISRLNT
jgi:hypothetical protein